MDIFRILGVILVLRLCYVAADFVLTYLRPSRLSRYLPQQQQRAKHGDPVPPSDQQTWAFITGASGGIGRGFADALAARGFSIVLHGRDAARLERARGELQARHPTRGFRVIVADAEYLVRCLPAQPPAHQPSSPGVVAGIETGTLQDSFAALARSVADLDLRVLVNNAGGTPARRPYGALDEYTADELAGNIGLLAVFPALLAAALLPLLGRGGRLPALIINVGSLADNGAPLLPAYAPCKAYLATWSVALAREMRMRREEAEGEGWRGGGGDVEVLGLRVGEVCGTASNIPGPSFLVPDVETLVAAALARVGCGRKVVIPYWPHALPDTLVRFLLPEPVVDALYCSSMRQRRDEWRASAAKEK